MWYHYQIINRLSGVLKAESYEQLEDKQEMERIGKIAMSNLKLNGAIYTVKVVPVNDNFLLQLKRQLLMNFKPDAASKLILKIAEYKHAGGSLENEEQKLLSLLEAKITAFENHHYETLQH